MSSGLSAAWRDEYKRDLADMRAEICALISKPSVVSTTTLLHLGSQANKKPKVELSLPETYTSTWDSPVWEQISHSSAQLSKADQGHQKGLRSLFADLLSTAPTTTPFVFHDVHSRPSVCGSDLKLDAVMGLRDKPCNPLTTAAIICIKGQDGGYDSDKNVGKAITYGRAFLQQLPRTLRVMVLVVLTDLRTVTLISVRLDVDRQGNQELSWERTAKLPDVKQKFLQLLSCEPQRWFIELPNLGPSMQVTNLLGFGATSHVYEASQGGHQVVAKVSFSQELGAECAILQRLQGVVGVPKLLHDQCVDNSILMTPVLAPLTAEAVLVHNLHNSLHSLVQALRAAHGKSIVNRDVKPGNMMHSQSTIYLVDWGSATVQQSGPYEGTMHYASLGVLQQLTQDRFNVEVRPADDLESLVATLFCISHPDAHSQLQTIEKVPLVLISWWTQTWNPRPQWQLALSAARAIEYDTLADCLQALLE